MSINKSNDKNIPTDPEACSDMTDLVVGDLIELLYEDSPQNVMRATVSRILTDQDEGMGPEVEDYVACWFEIDMTCVEGEDAKQIMILSTDFKYSLNGRHVTVRTCEKPLQTAWAVNHVSTKVLYYEAFSSQEEIYLEETEEQLRADLISDDPSPSQNIILLAKNCGDREFDCEVDRSIIDANNSPRVADSLDGQLDHAVEELITGDSDEPPLSEEAVVEMFRITRMPEESGP